MFFRNGGTWGSRRDGRDELWDDDEANAQFYILYRNLVLGIGTIDLNFKLCVKRYEEFYFRELKMKGIYAAFPIAITLFSKHLK